MYLSFAILVYFTAMTGWFFSSAAAAAALRLSHFVYFFFFFYWFTRRHLFILLFAIHFWLFLSVSAFGVRIGRAFGVRCGQIVCVFRTTMVTSSQRKHFARTSVAPTNFLDRIIPLRLVSFAHTNFAFTYRFQLQWFSFGLHCCCPLILLRCEQWAHNKIHTWSEMNTLHANRRVNLNIYKI